VSAFLFFVLLFAFVAALIAVILAETRGLRFLSAAVLLVVVAFLAPHLAALT